MESFILKAYVQGWKIIRKKGLNVYDKSSKNISIPEFFKYEKIRQINILKHCD